METHNICLLRSSINLKSFALLTKFRVISFIKEELPCNFLHNNIPRIIRSTAAHYGGQNSVSCIDISLSFRKLTDDWVISGSNLMENAIDTLKLFVIFNSDTIIGLIIILH